MLLSSLSSAATVGAVGLILSAAPAHAFPPYRSTDADTADPYTLELRVGLVEAQREGDEMDVTAPLTRINFGLPRRVELISELEYRPEDGKLGDGALGAKWVPVFGETLSAGIEALALLPVRPHDQSAGAEVQIVATHWGEGLRLHVNAGGFDDPRGAADERGWRASVLTELVRDGWRPGIELAARQVSGEEADVRAGLGVIIDLGAFDLRAAAHAGLTSAAPDVGVSFWISTKLAFR